MQGLTLLAFYFCRETHFNVKLNFKHYHYSLKIKSVFVINVQPTSKVKWRGGGGGGGGVHSLESHLTAVSYKRKYVHEVLVTYLFKLAQEKVWLVELTVQP